MKSEGLGKILGIAFLVAVLVYVVSFTWIQHRREHKGPWLVVFMSDSAGKPYLLISQASLKVRRFHVSFPDQRINQANLVRAIYFDGPRTNTPFGQVVFQDPTFLPGTITFNFWGHEIELMPRTVVIDKKEVPWTTKTNVILHGTGKIPITRPK